MRRSIPLAVVAALAIACGGTNPAPPLDRDASVDAPLTAVDSAVTDDAGGSAVDDSGATSDSGDPTDSGATGDSGFDRDGGASVGDGGQCSGPGECDSAHPCPMVGNRRGTCCASIVVGHDLCGSCSGGVCPG